jgi:hypothetical protein
LKRLPRHHLFFVRHQLSRTSEISIFARHHSRPSPLAASFFLHRNTGLGTMEGLQYLCRLRGVAFPNIGGTMLIGHSLHREIWRSIACLGVLGSRPGEHNRYGKGHEQPISIGHVPVYIPPTVKETKHIEYRHTPLAGTGDEIRLLELLPTLFSKSRDFIACRLVVTRLSENPQYEALSYTWGTRPRDIPIFVVPDSLPEGLVVSEALPVTPQLYAALKRLRWEKKSRFLWVD